MTKEQRTIERIHNKLMDIRDARPMRRGSITAETRYARIYKLAYKGSVTYPVFCQAAEKYRQFLHGFKSRTPDSTPKITVTHGGLPGTVSPSASGVIQRCEPPDSTKLE